MSDSDDSYLAKKKNAKNRFKEESEEGINILKQIAKKRLNQNLMKIPLIKK